MRIVIAVTLAAMTSHASAKSTGYEAAKAALTDCAESAVADYSTLDRSLPERTDMVVTRCGSVLDHAVDAITQRLDVDDDQGARETAVQAFRDWVGARLTEAK